MSAISNIAMASPVGMSTGHASLPTTGAHAHAAAGHTNTQGQSVQGFSNPEMLMAMLMSASQTHHHHHAHSGASESVALSLGPQSTGSTAGYSAMSTGAASVGAQLSVHG